MLKNRSRIQIITLWFVTVALAVATSILVGTTATPTTWAFLLLISLVPPAITFVVWPGAPALTVAEVLHPIRKSDVR